ncbi:MAG: RluA family pseudouridine synthase [Flavobacteriales bacterium]|nr:RluA family pseudouridine synthase [Flavobacteriales bacterium]
MRTTKENIQVIYEDNHIIVINKRAGDIVQGDKTGDVPLVDVVKEYLKEKYSKPGNVFCGLAHRIDRPTTGAVIFAKTSKALSRLTEMFRLGNVHKTYHAIVPLSQISEKGTLDGFMIKDGKLNRSRVYATQKNETAKHAVTHYTVLHRGERYMLLEVEIETGRHHQIRCHLASIGIPIKGDLKYGAQRSNEDGSISLHARQLDFVHPVSGEHIIITAPYPQEENSLWCALSQEK